MTPWQEIDGVFYKRDDLFSFGAVNGSKLRQLMHLFSNYKGNATRVITAASVVSPQHAMTAYCAQQHGIPSLHIIASPNPMAHASTRIAASYGAQFHTIKVGYNPALQAELRRLQLDSDFVVPYGITTDIPERILPFHEVGAAETENTPPEVRTLYVPAGSCNSLTSILLGLARNPHNVERVVGVGIGPDRTAWVHKRLAVMGINSLPFEWDSSISLAKTYSYGTRVKESVGDISVHPNYEGKLIRFLKESGRLRQPNVGVWIVGAELK